MPNFKKNKSRGFKMSRNAGNPFNYGEGTGREESPLKHDPEGYYASKEKEVAPKEASEKPVEKVEESKKPVVSNEKSTPEEKKWTKEDGSKDYSYGSPHNTTWENIGIKARELDEKSSNWLRGLWD